MFLIAVFHNKFADVLRVWSALIERTSERLYFVPGGETIKQINQQTGAHCELDRRNQSNENEKIFIIRGNPEQVEHAKRIFSEKLGMVCLMILVSIASRLLCNV